MKHWRREDIRKKRIMAKSEMIKNAMRQLEEDAKEQVDYRPSKDLEGIFEEVMEEPQRKKKRTTGPVFCPLCRKKGHVTACSKHCDEKADENPVNIAARLATREFTVARADAPPVAVEELVTA